MGTPAEFRTYSRQCIELARKTNNRERRETLLEMAETWLGLAGAPEAEFERLKSDGFASDDMGRDQEPEVA